MTEPKWTPGPWTTDESEHDAPYEDILIRASKHHTICTIWIDDKPVHDFNSQQQANSHLIAAAPDLYAAAKQAQTLLNAFIGPDDTL